MFEKRQRADYRTMGDIFFAVMEQYDALSIEDRITTQLLGTEDEPVSAYQWLTINAPAGSDAEAAAKISNVPFHATTQDEPQDTSFLGKIKQFFEKCKAFVIRIVEILRNFILGGFQRFAA